jgi:hypothetical protein
MGGGAADDGRLPASKRVSGRSMADFGKSVSLDIAILSGIPMSAYRSDFVRTIQRRVMFEKFILLDESISRLVQPRYGNAAL